MRQNIIKFDYCIGYPERLKNGRGALPHLDKLGGPLNYAIWHVFMRADWQMRQQAKKQLLDALTPDASSKDRRRFFRETCIGFWNPFSWIQVLFCYLHTRATCHPNHTYWLYFTGALYSVVTALCSTATLFFAIPFAFFMLPFTLMLAIFSNFFHGCTGRDTTFWRDIKDAIDISLSLFNPLNHYFNRMGEALYDICMDPIALCKTLIYLGVMIGILCLFPYIIESFIYSFTSDTLYSYLMTGWKMFMMGSGKVASFLLNDCAFQMLNWIPVFNFSVSQSFAEIFGVVMVFIPLGLSAIGTLIDYGQDRDEKERNEREEQEKEFKKLNELWDKHGHPRPVRESTPSQSTGGQSCKRTRETPPPDYRQVLRPKGG